MRQPHVLSLLAFGVASSAAWQQLVPGLGSTPARGLVARQDGSECSILDTCSQCFGEGYIVCDGIGCFNPDIHQQCCAGASLCVGRTNNCCKDWGGPGVTGTSGVATGTPSTPTATQSSESYTCSRGDTGEECCQRAPNPPLHWCSGEFPYFRCYNDKNQWCCTDGTVCDEEDCCELFNASTTHPWAAAATSTVTSTATNSGASAGSITEAPTSGTAGSGAASTSAPQSTTSSRSGASPSLKPQLLALGLPALGLFAL